MMDELRATALALRDLLEQTGAKKGSLTFDGVTLTASDRGIYVATNGQTEDITEWVESIGMVVA